jgi:hypothetical protein
MKILILILLPITLLAQGGQNCITAMTTLPINHSHTTCGQGNDQQLASSTCNNAVPGFYTGGGDYLYGFVAPFSGLLTINFTISNATPTSSTQATIYVTQGCPNTTNCIFHSFVFAATAPPLQYQVQVFAGITYYIYIDSNASGCYNYTLSAAMNSFPVVACDLAFNSLAGWHTQVGTVGSSVAGAPAPFFPSLFGTVPSPAGQFTLMSASTDPFGGFPISPAGYGSVLRLGNTQTNHIGRRVSRRYQVNSSNSMLTYHFAIVLQDPAHVTHRQPFFEAVVLDQIGNPIPCSRFIVAAASGLPGFQNSSTAGVVFRPWSSVSVDLADYIGQIVTVRFTAGACAEGAHWGYAYIDGQCEQSLFLDPDFNVCWPNCITLPTPPNYVSYSWPQGGPQVCNAGTYTVVATSQNGCSRVFTFNVSANGHWVEISD